MPNDRDAADPTWKILSGKTLVDNPWIRVRRYDALAPTGALADYTLVHFKKIAVGVLPIADDGQVHLVGQMRFAFGQYSWEAPEGGCEANEDPLAAAVREMAEESGLQARHIEKMLEFDVSNSITDERAICYLAFGLSPAAGQQDDVELLKRRTMPFLDALDMVAKGEIRDSLTVAMLLRAHHMAVTGGIPDPVAKFMLRR